MCYILFASSLYFHMDAWRSRNVCIFSLQNLYFRPFSICIFGIHFWNRVNWDCFRARQLDNYLDTFILISIVFEAVTSEVLSIACPRLITAELLRLINSKYILSPNLQTIELGSKLIGTWSDITTVLFLEFKHWDKETKSEAAAKVHFWANHFSLSPHFNPDIALPHTCFEVYRTRTM